MTPEAFLARIDRSAGPDGCWPWTGKHTAAGYGRALIDGAPRQRSAHTIAYELLIGPIAIGLEPDHLCLNKGCVNPAHLEPVTHAENTRRWWATRVRTPRLEQDGQVASNSTAHGRAS
jgi:hypothetical protein